MSNRSGWINKNKKQKTDILSKLVLLILLTIWTEIKVVFVLIFSSPKYTRLLLLHVQITKICSWGDCPQTPLQGFVFGHFTTFMAYEFACLHYVWPYNFITILLVFYIFFKIKVFCTRHCLEQIICNIMVMKVGWRGPLGIFAYGPHRLSNHHWPLLTGNQYDSFICILQFNS